ncbi:C4-dicarboxylate/malic acid transporter [Penicillium odoratum]|uniref:C4-dicarboxylate/malic acid transporter n=1 Tax=Penicillium odoratum TaxID=1167516 RepID=UPI002547BB25|nr:C4-dicarboxylate/malic acid transporter [Penicillium odoratum]KAJ5769708.1 C4-dicarboxylate/malic acid transporter [Penicillium odoratum]
MELQMRHTVSHSATEGGNIDQIQDNYGLKLGWSKRSRHITWAYFTLTMSTGGLASVFHSIPYRFPGLETIGTVVFLLNIILYLLIWSLILTRFYLHPRAFKASFLHPTESFCLFRNNRLNISQYGIGHTGSWPPDTVSIIFWTLTAIAIIFSVGIYVLLYVFH